MDKVQKSTKNKKEKSALYEMIDKKFQQNEETMILIRVFYLPGMVKYIPSKFKFILEKEFLSVLIVDIFDLQELISNDFLSVVSKLHSKFEIKILLGEFHKYLYRESTLNLFKYFLIFSH